VFLASPNELTASSTTLRSLTAMLIRNAGLSISGQAIGSTAGNRRIGILCALPKGETKLDVVRNKLKSSGCVVPVESATISARALQIKLVMLVG